MALLDNAFYVDFGDGATTGYYAVTPWAINQAHTAGDIVRQLTTPAVNSERTFVCYNSVGGTGQTSATTEPTWVITRGGLTPLDNSVRWQEATGIAALNGDLTNTPTWTAYRTATTSATLGQVIQNTAGTLLLICTVAGTMSALISEPSWAAYTTTGATTTDTSATWVTLGAFNKYSGWASPHARINCATTLTWGTGGNSIFVASEHAETGATIIGGTGATSVSNPMNVLCVAKTPVPPTAVTTGATWAAASAANIQPAGNSTIYFSGFAFSAGGQLLLNGSGVFAWMRFDNCSFALTGAVTTNGVVAGGNSTYLEWNNCSFKGFDTASFIRLNGSHFNWRNSTALAAGSPTPAVSLIQTHNFGSGVFDGIDFTGLTTALVGVELNSPGPLVFKNCKIPAGVPLSTTSIAVQYPSANDRYFVSCDSAATNYRNEKWSYQGTLTTTGGLSNNVGDGVYHINGATDGVTPVAWKMATTANCKWSYAFQSVPITAWNTAAGSSQTVTAYGIVNAAAVPNTDQFWIEIEYMGTVGSPLANLATGTKASILASGSPQSADTGTWIAPGRLDSTSYAVGAAVTPKTNFGRVFFCTTAGTTAASEPAGYGTAIDGGSVTDGGAVFRAGCRFSIALTFTPQVIGYLTVVAKAGLASTTYYFDPKVVLTA